MKIRVAHAACTQAAPGAVAQLGERLNGIQEVRGSIPLGSIDGQGCHRSSGVEHSIRNRAVVGSNPTGGSGQRAAIGLDLPVQSAGVAQLAEHQLPKLRVAGSNPVSRSFENSGSVPSGVIGNTPDSDSGKSRFDPWGGNGRCARWAAVHASGLERWVSG